jgi:hypothetical protein
MTRSYPGKKGASLFADVAYQDGITSTPCLKQSAHEWMPCDSIQQIVMSP